MEALPHALSAREDLKTWANLVTAVRTIVGMVVFAVAAYHRDAGLNYVGLALFWALDILDGALARGLKQETRVGAQFDIITDRILIAFFYFNFVALRPEFVVPVATFLFQFNVIDLYLSNQFMRWPIVSPNYFHQVDRTIWRLNWSVPAKTLNSQFVPLIMIITGSVWIPCVISLGIIGLKIYSFVLIRRLPDPNPAWPASRMSMP